MKKNSFVITFILIVAVLATGVCIAVFSPVPIPSDLDGMIRVYTRNKPNVQLTIAVITDNGTEISAYGHDGVSIPVPDRSYEIGDITRTFTGAIVAKAVSEGKFSPGERISDFLPLSRAAYSPTVYELLTHSSAYSDYAPDVSGNVLTGSNPYTGITANDLVSEMNSFKLALKPPYLYSYSDFGASAVGAVLSQIYDVDFYSILTIFAREELALKHTFIPIESGIEHGWTWKDTDAYIAASSLVSTIGDMVAYARLYLNDSFDYLTIAADPAYEVNADQSVGYFWNLIDRGRVLQHSGETSHYASSILIDRVNRIAVVLLSNYGNDRFGNVDDLARVVFNETRDSVLK